MSKYFSQRSFADKNRALSKYSGGKHFSVRSSLAFGKQNHQNFGICISDEIQLKDNSKSCHCSKREGEGRGGVGANALTSRTVLPESESDIV